MQLDIMLENLYLMFLNLTVSNNNKNKLKFSKTVKLEIFKLLEITSLSCYKARLPGCENYIDQQCCQGLIFAILLSNSFHLT